MQTATDTPADVVPETVEPPEPTSSHKLKRRVVKSAPPPEPTATDTADSEPPNDATPPAEIEPDAEPTPDTPPADAEAAAAAPWSLSRFYGHGKGLEIRATGNDRIHAAFHLIRAAGENGPLQRITQQRLAIRDQLAAKVRAQAEATPAFANFAAVRSQFQAHQKEVNLAKATIEELTARRKRLELSNETDLAARLEEIGYELEDAAAVLALAEKAAATLAPIVAQRRVLLEQEVVKFIDPAVGEIRKELREKEDVALAALMMANTELLDDLAVCDSLLRTIANGGFGTRELAHNAFGD